MSGFSKRAFAATAAATAEAALELLQTTTPDLILSDTRLPNLDGYGLVRKLKERTEWSGIPVVFLTAYSNKDVQDQAKLTEPYGYILKPFDEREMHGAIEAALIKHRRKRELQERGE